MEKVKVEFEFEGKKVIGSLESVFGAGSTSMYHLYVEKFYWGRLRRANDQWWFDPTPTTQELKNLADYFGSFVTP